jgi:hypothetical protein
MIVEDKEINPRLTEVSEKYTMTSYCN